MTPTLARRSFIAFHLVLGLALLAASLETLVHSLAPPHHGTHVHLAIVAAAEAVGAVLFLVPRTLRVGAVLLVAIIVVAFIVHSVQGEWRPDLAVYAAGVWFVFAHGSGWQLRQPGDPT